MKWNFILSFFILIYTNAFSQNSLDLEGIKRASLDTISDFSYNSLIKEFNQSPSGLDIIKGTIIYYGKLFKTDYKPYRIDFDVIDFTKLISKKKYKQAIPKGVEILKSDPANLEILSLLFICYQKLGITDQVNFVKAKLDLLTASILDHGNGEHKDHTLKVVTVGDEYAIMRILGIRGLSLKSDLAEGSAFDNWKVKDSNGRNVNLFVEVIYEFTGAY